MSVNKNLLLIGVAIVGMVISARVKAEECTIRPGCASLGYTEASCPENKGLKCLWGDLWFCTVPPPACTSTSCAIGDVLYSDKKCYKCQNKEDQPAAGLVPIGVVFDQKKAIGLVDLGRRSSKSQAEDACDRHNPGGINGWRLPERYELADMSSNINAVQTGLQSAVGGSKLSSTYYWTKTLYYQSVGTWIYYVVNPVNGDNHDEDGYTFYSVRPVLYFN